MKVRRFIGRERELALLDEALGKVKAGGRAGRPGRALLMRGRRRVGKSRLAEEFVERAGVPHVFFTASAQPTKEADLHLFVEAVTSSDLPGADVFQGQTPTSWDAALRLLAAALPPGQPSVVVLDELPYLIGNDAGFEGTLQKLYDRELSRRPVLLLCIGSDLAMMERLNEYGRPFHQRATEMVVPALSPADVAAMLGLPPEYLTEAVDDPTSALLVSAERALAAEFPAEAQARRVLGAIGSGERAYSQIGRAAGNLPQASLGRALQLLTTKRLVEATVPLSTRPSRETRYVVTDPYLRFWLTFLGPHLDEIERGRGDLALGRIQSSWTSWRGRAIEPVIREGLRRLAQGLLPAGTNVIGGYWTRTNDPQIDIVGADREPVAKRIMVVGSVKWLESRPFDSHDLARLAVHRSRLPGTEDDTPLLVVSREGTTVGGVLALGADELVTAWRA